MRSYPNVDRSAFRPGQYVAYGRDGVWTVRRVGERWQAVCRDVLRPSITDDTLGAVARRVGEMASA